MIAWLRDPKNRQAIEIESCRRDIFYWLNNYVYCYEPRGAGNVSVKHRLKPFQRQQEYVNWLYERDAKQEGGLVEKCRDAGVTWFCAAFAVHGWRFRNGYAVGFGSRKLELVDRLGDPDTIFEKIRYILRNMPVWLLPPGFRWSEHDNLSRIINPDNYSSITGEGGDNIGRGGRKSIYFLDEAAHVERPELVDRALSATTEVRIDVSTPNGAGNPFYQKRFSGRVPVFVFDWKEDPRKNKTEVMPDGKVIYPWYEKEKKRLDPVTLAQEVDRDYAASMAGVAIPAAWVRASVGLALPKSAPTSAGLDVGGDSAGGDPSVWCPRYGPVVGMPQSWKSLTTDTSHQAVELTDAGGFPILNYDVIGMGEGVKGTTMRMPTKPKCQVVPVNTGMPPSDTIWKDGKRSKEKFLNLRAEIWWILRDRFEKTYEYVTQGVAHPPEDMISLPEGCPELVAELSLPLYERTEAGKIQIESKKKMRSRGVKSPNYADALALCFVPEKPMANIFVLPMSTQGAPAVDQNDYGYKGVLYMHPFTCWAAQVNGKWVQDLKSPHEAAFVHNRWRPGTNQIKVELSEERVKELEAMVI